MLTTYVLIILSKVWGGSFVVTMHDFSSLETCTAAGEATVKIDEYEYTEKSLMSPSVVRRYSYQKYICVKK